MNARNRQRGFSLIELMVAMVVSLILLAGILQILLGNRQSFEAQQAMAGLQQNGRLASFVLENAVAHAGYRVKFDQSRERIFPDGFISGANSDVDDGSDTIRIRFKASGGLNNCVGTRVGADDDAQIADFELKIDDDNDLVCEVFGPIASTPQNLISNVQTLQIRYGIDTDNDDSVDTYSNAPSDWTRVRSVRIQLLLVSEGNVLPTATAQTFTFADGQEIETNDRRARHLVDQTIALRNLLP